MPPIWISLPSPSRPSPPCARGLDPPGGIQLAIWSLRNDANESITDPPLTGLLNRRGLQLHLADLFRDVVAAATDVAVIVVDLDRFKSINDTFGHIAGERF